MMKNKLSTTIILITLFIPTATYKIKKKKCIKHIHIS